MRLQVWAWRCEVVTCGHTWLAVGVDPPAQCSKCKSRQWHTKISFDGKLIATDVTRMRIGFPADGEVPIGKPDLEALVSGIMGRPSDHGFSIPAGSTITAVRVEMLAACLECDKPMREFKGKWACNETSCAMYGIEQKLRN